MIDVADIAQLDKYLIAKSPDNGWYYAEIFEDLEQPSWVFLTTPDPDAKLNVIGQMAYQVDDTDVFWVDALLCNSADVEDVNAFAIYVDPRDDEIKVKEWSNSFPDDEGGTTDSMPRANVCTMWGDFLVLGDIIWKADPDQPFDAENKSRYRHGLWFSIPGKPDRWDPIDVIEMGQKSGNNLIQGIHPLEAGLIVVTKSLVVLLQGPPDDFIYRELRSGISNTERHATASWPFQGGVVWADVENGVWFTNGEVVLRLDEVVDLKGCTAVSTWNQYIFVSTNEDVRVFRVIGEAGAWTTLAETFSFSKIVRTDKFLFGLELSESNRKIAAFDLKREDRGTFDGRNVKSVIRSRPLPGFGHDVIFWHRAGVRAKGTGRVQRFISRPSADPSVRGYEVRLSGDLRRRFDYVFDCHGPSIEATFDVEFEGDVTVEHMTVWEHGGRTEK